MSTPKYPVLAVFVIGFVVIAGSHLFEQLFPSEVAANKADSASTAVSELSRKIDQQKQNVEAIVTPEAEEPTVMPELDVPIAQMQLAVEELNDADPPVVVQDGTQVSVEDSTNDSVVSQQIDLPKQVVEKIAALESDVRKYIPEGDSPLVELQPAVNELKDVYPPVVVQDIIEDLAEDSTNDSVVSQQIDLPKQVVEKVAALESEEPTVMPVGDGVLAPLQPTLRKIEEIYSRDVVQNTTEHSIEDGTKVLNRTQTNRVQGQEAGTKPKVELTESVAIAVDSLPLAQRQPAFIELEEKLLQDLILDATEDSYVDHAIGLDENKLTGIEEQKVDTVDLLEPADLLAGNMLSEQILLTTEEQDGEFSPEIAQDVVVVFDESLQADTQVKEIETNAVVEPDVVVSENTLAARSATPLHMESYSPQTEQVLQLLNEQLPGIVFSDISASPAPSLFEVVADGQIYYVNESAQYLIDGSLIRLSDQTNITDERLGLIHMDLINQIDEENMLIFAPETPSNRSITVFTDISCGFCRRLHAEIDTLMDAGVTVRYLLFPRAGIGSQGHKDLESVWCADNQQEAMTKAKAGGSIDAKSCDNPIEEHVALAEKLSLRGTPLIYTDSGVKIPGYREARILVNMVNDSVPMIPN